MQNIATRAAERNPIAPAPDVGDVADLPVGFDPACHPIIATHFYGWRPVAIVAAQVVQDFAFRRSCALAGERPIGAP